MDEQTKRYWLRLSRLELNPRLANDLLEKFGSPEVIFNVSDEELLSVKRCNEKHIEKIRMPEPAVIQEDLKKLDKYDIKILTIKCKDYPQSLKNIYDPPVMLYMRGKVIERDKLSIAIVGSRKASIYGKSIAEKLSKELAQRSLTIVSGGARGIDTCAHTGALAVGGRTIAFLGCGIDIVYPAENKAMFSAISKNGAILSEFPMGSNPDPWRFPARNRLVSGISMGVLVCQSPITSGALITAEYALEQGRNVWAVPGNIDDSRNQGCHKLIKDGAGLVESAEDIFFDLGIDKKEENHTLDLDMPVESFSEDEQKIISLLSLEPVSMDDIIRESGLPVSKVSGALIMLEMKRLVKKVPGDSYVRAV
ncbi:MAG: DNA-processing protein DprA [Armatimonadota bacterium]